MSICLYKMCDAQILTDEKKAISTTFETKDGDIGSLDVMPIAFCLRFEQYFSLK